jgi:histidinol-phosphate aminotransferase
VKRAPDCNRAGLRQVAEGLAAAGYSPIPSQGNFLLFPVKGEAAALYDRFLRKGVIVRPVANYGLPEHLRVSIGTAAENAKFLAAAKELKA